MASEAPSWPVCTVCCKRRASHEVRGEGIECNRWHPWCRPCIDQRGGFSTPEDTDPWVWRAIRPGRNRPSGWVITDTFQGHGGPIGRITRIDPTPDGLIVTAKLNDRALDPIVPGRSWSESFGRLTTAMQDMGAAIGRAIETLNKPGAMEPSIVAVHPAQVEFYEQVYRRPRKPGTR